MCPRRLSGGGFLRFGGRRLDAAVGHQGPVLAGVGVETAFLVLFVDLHLEGFKVRLLVLVGGDIYTCRNRKET